MFEIVPEHRHQSEDEPNNNAEADRHFAISEFDDDAMQLDDAYMSEQSHAKISKKVWKPPEGLSKQLKGVSVSDILQQYVPMYSSNLPKRVRELITHARQLAQQRVYNSQTAKPQDFLQFIYQNEVEAGKHDREAIQQVLASRHLAILTDIQHGHLELGKKKKQSVPLSEMLKMQEGQIKSKLVDLRRSINQSLLLGEITNDPMVKDLSSPDNFSADNEKTRQAEQFIRKIRAKQQQIKKKHEQLAKKELQEKEEQSKAQAERKRQQEVLRHEKIKERYQRRREQVQKEQEEKQMNVEEFKQFIRKHRLSKPLFKRKQEAFSQNYLLPELEKYKMRLQQIKEERQPITSDDFDEHEKNYLDMKEEYECKREEERRLRKIEQKKRHKSEYYRGRFHELVEEEMERERYVEDPKDAGNAQRARKQAYAKLIKMKFPPKIDPDKRKEIEQMIEQSTKSNRKRLRKARKEPLGLDSIEIKDTQEPDAKLDGLKNLDSVRKMIESMKRAGRIKPISEEKRAVSVSLQPRPDYLKELRRRRAEVSTSRVRYDEPEILDPVSDFDGFHRAKIKANLIDQHAQRRERILKLNRNQPEANLEEASKLEDDYLASIKAKLAILHSHDKKY